MAFGKKNVIKIDPFSYNIGLLGEGGIGKTCTIFNMCQKYLGDDGYLFAECGKEDGASALSGINYINCPDWDSEYDDLNNSVGFNLLVEDIIENKDKEYPNLRVLVIDTFDQLRKIVEPEVIRLHNKQHPEKRVNSVRAAFGGFMAGDDMCDDIILDKLWELKNVGVQFIIIGHVKTREISDEMSGTTYSQLTTDMSMRTFNKIKTKLHFLGVAYVDREIVKEQKGNKKDKNVVKSEARKIAFRDDSYSIDSKSRFADIDSECALDADALYQTMCDAIKREAEKGGGDIKKMQKTEEAENKERKKRASEYSAKAKENKVDTDRNDELVEQIKPLYKAAEQETKDAVKEIMAEYEIESFKDVSETPTVALEKILSTLS